MHRATPGSARKGRRESGSPGFETPPLMVRQRLASQDSVDPPFQRTLFRDDVSGAYGSMLDDDDDDDDEDGEAYDSEDEHEAMQRMANRPLGKKRLPWYRTKPSMRAAVDGLARVMEYTWLFLPGLCLAVAFIYPQYLIRVVQSSSGSLTSHGHSQAQAISSIQVHLDAMIHDMDALKKAQRDQSSKMDELRFLHEQTAERMPDAERVSTESFPCSGAEHTEEMVSSAVQKTLRDMTADVQNMLGPLESTIASLSGQVSALEESSRVQHTRLVAAEGILDALATEAPRLEAADYTEAHLQLTQEMARFKTDLATWIREETSRISSEIRATLTSRRSSQGRIDYASRANGARVAMYKSDFFGSWLESLLMNWMSPAPYTSPSYSDFPLCSLLGTSCPLTSSNPETTIADSPVGQLPTCWSLQGSSGKLTIQFRDPIVAETVQLYRPETANDGAGNSNASTAPKMFQVTGLALDPVLQRVLSVDLGTFEFAADGPSTQEFALSALASRTPIDGVTLHVLSNYGHDKYTCLYRIGVFGQKL
ncbi:hypothetical protein SPRG_06117 [Saprolegnia parasitica CBS 223.65]|uniref:SUN domain-containing protein n=1 Tax=Saprolegnia parasitica (strain CBS 223.65) TaxID=695850 RepID=A0A067CQG9_SAPPC|nr:hypothetical protein SPRG_06117 [Saprolegnia parasitica CBS 223.65]KDO29062.1 hypothetical protein SPRG_06117 [Saprolegnia parasitica CBS 223.65]|eukprot:XP_012200232.1 hypothetical protein SPRG_06117 [Saprolegnia parasitica CBS 223.65]